MHNLFAQAAEGYLDMSPALRVHLNWDNMLTKQNARVRLQIAVAMAALRQQPWTKPELILQWAPFSNPEFIGVFANLYTPRFVSGSPCSAGAYPQGNGFTVAVATCPFRIWRYLRLLYQGRATAATLPPPSTNLAHSSLVRTCGSTFACTKTFSFSGKCLVNVDKSHAFPW